MKKDVHENSGLAVSKTIIHTYESGYAVANFNGSQAVTIRWMEKTSGGEHVGTVDKQSVVTMQELLVFSLATADAVAKLMIEMGLITEAEFMQKLSAERAVYQGVLRKMK